MEALHNTHSLGKNIHTGAKERAARNVPQLAQREYIPQINPGHCIFGVKTQQGLCFSEAAINQSGEEEEEEA